MVSCHEASDHDNGGTDTCRTNCQPPAASAKRQFSMGLDAQKLSLISGHRGGQRHEHCLKTGVTGDAEDRRGEAPDGKERDQPSWLFHDTDSTTGGSAAQRRRRCVVLIPLTWLR
jgi:hypothetical protein